MQINGFYGLMSYNLRQLDFFYTEYDQNIEKNRNICYNGSKKRRCLMENNKTNVIEKIVLTFSVICLILLTLIKILEKYKEMRVSSTMQDS